MWRRRGKRNPTAEPTTRGEPVKSRGKNKENKLKLAQNIAELTSDEEKQLVELNDAHSKFNISIKDYGEIIIRDGLLYIKYINVNLFTYLSSVINVKILKLDRKHKKISSKENEIINKFLFDFDQTNVEELYLTRFYFVKNLYLLNNIKKLILNLCFFHNEEKQRFYIFNFYKFSNLINLQILKPYFKSIKTQLYFFKSLKFCTSLKNVTFNHFFGTIRQYTLKRRKNGDTIPKNGVLKFQLNSEEFGKYEEDFIFKCFRRNDFKDEVKYDINYRVDNLDLVTERQFFTNNIRILRDEFVSVIFSKMKTTEWFKASSSGKTKEEKPARDIEISGMVMQARGV